MGKNLKKTSCDSSTGCCDSEKKENIEVKVANIENCDPSTGCCTPASGLENEAKNKVGIQRRDFMKTMGLGLGSLALMGLSHPLSATGILQEGYQIPINKNLDPDWIQSLYERGVPETYTGKDLVYIGMPVGGICAGQVYLGGDGKLWLWDIFNEQKEGVVDATYYLNGRKVRARDGSNYIVPITQEYPFDQGFAIKIEQGDTKWEKRLDYKGFKDITFKGQYPVGEITYKDKGCPVKVVLKAYSPFIPLDVDASSYPATIMHYTISNTGNATVNCELSGWLENAAFNHSGVKTEIQLKNTIIHNKKSTSLVCEALLDENGSELDFQFEKKRDNGNMCLTLLGDDIAATAQEEYYSEALFPKEQQQKELATEPFGVSLRGGLSKSVTLKPGETKEISFVVSWYFPNLSADGNRFKGRSYSKRFKNAFEVSKDIVQNFKRLHTKTLAFADVFYNKSSLPYWFLNRTFANTSILATETCYLLEDGRFWAWEGIGCCPGTCTHVWHYAQAMGRVFPELERNLREQTDFKVIESNGKVDFRGGRANRDAADGQAGVVLRSYREHQMTADNTFLKTNWKHIKSALQYLIDMDAEDGEANGMIYGEQHNTLDAEWYGNIPVIISLYLAALKAGKEMAIEMNDTIFSKTCKTILKKGEKNIETLYNGEYFVQNEDPEHKDAIGIGTGCYIDQVFGQSWAFQLGLGRLYNKEMIQNSLDALWKYNFVPNMGEFRKSLPEKLAGRPYAIDDDAGLVMCTWPKGGKKDDWEKHWQFGYFNECMTGFEYQAAGHMIWEDKIEEGLTITKAIHDRYHAGKRNPYNEVECSDHYARAMASYGVYLAACGFEYHGPKKQLAFAPKLHPENFEAGFIAAKGWGTYAQIQKKNKQQASIKLVSGSLVIKEISLEIPKVKKPKKVALHLDGKRIKNKYTTNSSKVRLKFKAIEITENAKLTIEIKYS
ncbi:GH116 family glycosyl-hydrolase [Polaribacter cellanae]|uniref:Twin-arginine translocation signal domain-containing protein n=1 Tax=Polaribacter cellanae TaxID=2818493 RepID=A0A975H831_9FLAO|nr:GH116 family glycosyl-hydrolase [Polaribacter cellanae]QTE23683.1 hypothetical protein J3359_05240 [Polaribacter cellanae]